MSYSKDEIQAEVLRILEQGCAAVKQVIDGYLANRTPERDMNWLCLQMAKEFGAIMLHSDFAKQAIRQGADGRAMDEKFETIKEEVAHFQGLYNLLNRTIGPDTEIPVKDIYRYVVANVGPNGMEMDQAMIEKKDNWPANFEYLTGCNAYLQGQHPWVRRVFAATLEGAAAGFHWSCSRMPADDDFLKEAARVERGIAIDELRHGPQELQEICEDYSPEYGVDLDEMFRMLRHARYLEVRQRNEQFLHPLSEERVEQIRLSLMEDQIDPINIYSEAA